MSQFYRSVMLTAPLVGFLLSACRPSSSSEEMAGAQGGSKRTSGSAVRKVGISYALGGKGDLSYNDAAGKGVKLLRGRGIEIQEFEPTNLSDYEKGLDLLSTEGLDVIFCVGFLYDDAALRIAKRSPTTRFVILDGAAASKPNVSSVRFQAGDGSFLAGAVAARISKKSSLAFVGGADIPVINEFRDGFMRGAAWSKPGIPVQAYYIGTGGAAFTDPVKGREVALTAISQGADVIYHASGSSGNGVIKAARESGVSAIGVDVDQNHLAPGTVVTSMMKNFDVAMTIVVEGIEAGQDIGGTSLSVGLKEGAVSLAPITGGYEKLTVDVIANARDFILRKGADPQAKGKSGAN